MEQRQLGSTGERVSAIGLGCMGMVGWYRQLPQELIHGDRYPESMMSTVDV